MAVPEYVWAVLAVATGILVVYYLCLRLSDNGWIGQRPRGPTHHPFIGCYLAYAGTRDLQTLVTQLFTTYGDMFALSLFSQKIVFIKNSKEFEASVRLEEVTDRSLAKLASILHHLGMPHLQEPQLELMSKAWQAHVAAPAPDSGCLTPDLPRLVGLLKAADHQLAVDWGELRSQPPSYPPKQHLSSSYPPKQQLSSSFPPTKQLSSCNPPKQQLPRIDEEAGEELCPAADRALQAATHLRELILRQGHVFLARRVPFPTTLYARRRGRKWVDEVRRSLGEVCRSQGLHTDRDLLLLFFLLIVFSRDHSNPPTEMVEGPSIGGYRIYQANQYIQLAGCNIPQNTLIVAQ